MVEVSPRPDIDDWNYLSRFEGLFPLGSEQDKQLTKQREELFRMPLGELNGLRYDSEFTEAGLASDLALDFRTDPIPFKFLDTPLAELYDVSSMILADQRVRWSRAGLEFNGFPSFDCTAWIDNDGRVSTDKNTFNKSTELKAKSIFDVILDNPEYRHGAVYFCVKMIRHAERAVALSAELIGKNDLEDRQVILPGLCREWMLFGESWSQASSITRHANDSLRGKKQKKSSSTGGTVRSNSYAQTREQVIAEMNRIIESGQNISLSRAAELAAKKGVGTSQGANIKLYRRHAGN